MKIKEEKGITGIDITIAILVITLFVSLLITLFYNLNANSTTIQRKTEATHIAIKVIEGIKANGFSNYQSYGSAVEYADNKKKEYDDGTYEIVDQGSVEENSAADKAGLKSGDISNRLFKNERKYRKYEYNT